MIMGPFGVGRAVVIHPLVAVFGVVLVLVVGFLLFLKLVTVMGRDQKWSENQKRAKPEGEDPYSERKALRDD